MRRAFFFIVAILFATNSFASIPRASMFDRANEDASTFAASLRETRIRVSDVLAPFEQPAPSLLNRALHQAYADVSTTNASGLAGFLSVDPASSAVPALPQTWNRYAYARNNPLKFVDPDGRDVWVAPGMQAAVDNGRQKSVAFAAMYDRLNRDSRVYWVIRPAANAKPGTRADSTQWSPDRDANGQVTRIMTFSNVPSRNALATQTRLIAHEGAHVTEVLDTNKTLKERYQAGERNTVYPNSAAGANAYESTNALQFEQLVGRELQSGVQVIQSTRDITDLLRNAPGVQR